MEIQMKSFEEANKTVHPVTKQWHYPILTARGYIPETQEAVGFVRVYIYTHPVTKHSMRLTTGSSSDYWKDMQTGMIGYWNDLNAHLDSIAS